MRSALLFAANLASPLLPQTRCFRLRALLFRAAGVRVSAGARILGMTQIYYPNVSIGDSWIGAGTHISCTSDAGVRIGDRCDIAPGVLFVTGSHVIGDSTRRAGLGNSKPISVGNGTWIGARSTILGGTTIGEGCVVAAGAVVRGDFPANVVIGGVPATVIKELPT